METSLDQKFSQAALRQEAQEEEGTEAKVEGDGKKERLHNISTCVVLDFKDLGLSHCSKGMMDQMKLYIG
jgi:hypothetical protein